MILGYYSCGCTIVSRRSTCLQHPKEKLVYVSQAPTPDLVKLLRAQIVVQQSEVAMYERLLKRRKRFLAQIGKPHK